MERGNGLTRDLAHTRPADILIAGWDRGKPAALDLTITSPLCSVILGESCYQAGAAALAAETRTEATVSLQGLTSGHMYYCKRQQLGCVLVCSKHMYPWKERMHSCGQSKCSYPNAQAAGTCIESFLG